MKEFLDLGILTCDEVAQMLKVKVNTVYSWKSYKQIPNEIYFCIGRRPRFYKDKLFDWIRQGAPLKPRTKKNIKY